MSLPRPAPTARTGWVFAAVVLVCLVGLARAQSYFGLLLRGYDAQMYYALAHSWAFDRDSDITNNLSLTPHPKPFDPAGDGTWAEVPRGPDGRFATKYPLGLSVVEAPLLAAGYGARAAAEAAGVRVPVGVGFSAIETWVVAVGLVLVFAAGLTAVYRELVGVYGRVAALAGVAALWAGTSLLYYTAVFPFMAHATSFALLAGVIGTARRLSADGPVHRPLVLFAVLAAGVFLVRPQQVLVAVFLLPELVAVARRKPVREWGWGAAAAAGVAAAAVLGQVLMHHHQTGAWTLSGYSAGGEGFRWADPRFDVVLVSRDRGLLVFSPVVLAAAAGLVVGRRSVPQAVWAAVANAVAQVYLIAAWSSPGQGDSFGCRMWADNAAVVGWGVAALLGGCPPRARWVAAAGVAAACVWTLLLLARELVRI